MVTLTEQAMADKMHNQASCESTAHEIATMREEISALRKTLEDFKAIQSPLVGIEQVATYFDKSPDTIRRWVQDRLISCYKIPNGRSYTYLFSMRQIEDDLAEYQQEAV